MFVYSQFIVQFRDQPCLAEWALVRVSWVVKVFELTMNSVVSASRSFSVSTRLRGVHIGYEMCAQILPGIRFECLADHLRAKLGAADADIYDVADRLAGMAAYIFRCALHRSSVRICPSTLPHFRHHIFAVHPHRPFRTVAQCGMQRGTVFG